MIKGLGCCQLRWVLSVCFWFLCFEVVVVCVQFNKDLNLPKKRHVQSSNKQVQTSQILHLPNISTTY